MASGSFLAIDYDSASDDPHLSSRVATEFRRANVEPRLKQVLALVPEPNANGWKGIADDITNDVVYFSGCGHGSEMAFPASPLAPVLTPGGYDTAKIRHRIIHLLACSTAIGLGPDLVSNGKADAFIGYAGLFSFPDPTASVDGATFANIFLDCDAQIDYCLTEGGSVSDAIKLTKSYFQHQSDMLLAQNPRVAHCLLVNAGLLRGPLVDSDDDNEFGKSSASFASSLQALSG